MIRTVLLEDRAGTGVDGAGPEVFEVVLCPPSRAEVEGVPCPAAGPAAAVWQPAIAAASMAANAADRLILTSGTTAAIATARAAAMPARVDQVRLGRACPVSNVAEEEI